jgi:hypothetical protein
VRLLEGYRKDRIVLMAHGVEAEPPFVGNFGNAVERLVGRASAAQDKRQQDFQARRRVVPDIAADADFGRIEYAWRAARGVMDQRLIEAMREASSGRHLEVAPQDGASKLVIGAVGEGYSLYGNGWKSVAIGGRFEDMPDYRYAQWASQAYREVFRTGQPVFEDVKAAVKLHRTGRLLLTYRRVILPIGGGERPTLLLGATLGQRVTRLGLEPSDELGDVFQ